ncbi:berberine bridge enzyme-like 3 [Silene latifolia]|uniref:berberine bridge enzyme-like 3 n=1 Tax=Silene latifolia TaxID=37657 RepID=UPI003D76AF68
MNMKIRFSNCTIYVILTPLLLLFLVSRHSLEPNSSMDNFLHCLPSKSSRSNPITNAIFTPTHPSFLRVLYAYIRDSRFNTSSSLKPLAIITALDESHVQATILCAKANKLAMRIRSGGHDFEGVSYVAQVPFVILDMFNLRSIDIDMASETGWVQAGATLGELYYNIANISNIHGFPAGVCHTVGTGGHFTGGGYGVMLRRFGLSIDNIVDARIVNANGIVLDRQTMGEDLFWSIRGGGAASFCVVLSWKINLVRVPRTFTVFNVSRTLEQGATDVVLQWQQVATKLDNNLFIHVEPQVQFQHGGRKTVRVLFIGTYLGRTESLIPLMNKNFPILGLNISDCLEMSWVKTNLFWGHLPQTTPIEVLLQRTPTPSHEFQKHKSDYVKIPIPRAGLETIWKKMIEVENVILQWSPYGGRMSEIAENATPFPHRAGILFKMQYITEWQDESEQALMKNIKATRDLHDTFTPYVSSNPRETFLNYRDIDIGTNVNGSLSFAVNYFKDNVNRLLKVKAKVDPTNFFRYEQSIPILASDQ